MAKVKATKKEREKARASIQDKGVLKYKKDIKEALGTPVKKKKKRAKKY